MARTVWRHGPWATREVVRRGVPRHLVYFYGHTPGDDLMCTVVLRELRERGHRGIWMMSRFPALFEGNRDVDAVVPHEQRYERMVEWLGGRAHPISYGGHDHVADRAEVPSRHILSLMCQSAGISGPVTLRPYLTLTAAERAAGRVGTRQIVLHSSGMSAYTAMRNKQWFPERFQAVADALRRDYTLVQLGAASDPPLAGCVDLRGRTSLRESAAIVANSRVLLGQVGFLMHLARAVDRPAVIVYGGREVPELSGYSCNTNLVGRVACAPCWRWNACHHEVERACMRQITVEEVVHAVRERAARADQPLIAQVDDVPAGPDVPALPSPVAPRALAAS